MTNRYKKRFFRKGLIILNKIDLKKILKYKVESLIKYFSFHLT